MGGPHRHSFYSIQLVTGGQGVQIIDFEPYPVLPSVLYMLSPLQVHEWQLKQSLKGFSLMFTDDFLVSSDFGDQSVYDFSFFNCLGHSPELQLKSSQEDIVTGLFSSIYDEFAEQKDNSPSVIRAYLHILLVSIQRFYESKEEAQHKTGKAVTARRFRNYVSQDFIQHRTIGHYARRMNFSEDHLQTIIRQATGKTPGQIIRDELILEAKRLLSHTDLNASEISSYLNMDDPSYFSRFFKQRTGMSPTSFRRGIREKYQDLPE